MFTGGGGGAGLPMAGSPSEILIMVLVVVGIIWLVSRLFSSSLLKRNPAGARPCDATPGRRARKGRLAAATRGAGGQVASRCSISSRTRFGLALPRLAFMTWPARKLTAPVLPAR
jgi:hypothetical protein